MMLNVLASSDHPTTIISLHKRNFMSLIFIITFNLHTFIFRQVENGVTPVKWERQFVIQMERQAMAMLVTKGAKETVIAIIKFPDVLVLVHLASELSWIKLYYLVSYCGYNYCFNNFFFLFKLANFFF